MIKKVLFIASILTVGIATAQTFQFNDHNDVNIANTTHYEYGTLVTLPLTKFHVENLTGATQRFAVKVEKEYVPYSNSGLGVCFGTACYSALATVSGVQNMNNGIGDEITANGTYTDIKISPVTWPWVNTVEDSVVWEVVIFNEISALDFVTARIIWKFRLTGDTNGDGVIGVGEIAGDVDGNGIIDGNEIAGDVTGDGVIGAGEFLDDNNGDGTLDRDDWLTAVNELDGNDIELSAYPNPASDNLTVKYSVKGNASNIILNVYDVLGQEIISENLNGNKGSVKLDLEAVNSGVYFYAIKVAGKTVRTERFIVR